MQQCNACGGIYNPIGADGVAYFHACPPLSVAELAAAVTAGKVVLPNGETPADAVTRRTYVRGNARNENPKSTAAKDTGSITSAGAGTTPVTAPAPVVVVV